MAKTAFITGAARGFGRAFTEALVKKNHRVCMVDFNSELGQKASAEINRTAPNSTIFVTADVTKPLELAGAYQQCKDHFGSLDIVCNNAGHLVEEDWEKMVDVNVVACIRSCQLATKHIDENGLIVNVASWAGVVPMVFGPVYTATKHAVVGFTRCLAREPVLEKKHVRVNCLCPGISMTEGASYAFGSKLPGMSDKQYERSQRTLKQVGTVAISDVVRAFLVLVDDQTKHQATVKVTPFGTEEHVFPKM